MLGLEDLGHVLVASAVAAAATAMSKKNQPLCISRMSQRSIEFYASNIDHNIVPEAFDVQHSACTHGEILSANLEFFRTNHTSQNPDSVSIGNKHEQDSARDHAPNETLPVSHHQLQ
jgi:hypothetical protein